MFNKLSLTISLLIFCLEATVGYAQFSIQKDSLDFKLIVEKVYETSQNESCLNEQIRLYLIGSGSNKSLSPTLASGKTDFLFKGDSIVWNNYKLEGDISGTDYSLYLWVVGFGTILRADIFIDTAIVATESFIADETYITSGTLYTFSGMDPITHAGDTVSLKIKNIGNEDAALSWGSGTASYVEIPNYSPDVPVELSSFEASLDNNSITLKWRTESETNNYGFEIEKKVSNHREGPNIWKKLVFIPGQGTTVNSQIYSYSDSSKSFSYLWYRIKQIDFDGNFEYSKEICLQVDNNFDYELKQNYPNPFNSETKIQYYVPIESFVKIGIYNLQGYLVKELVNSNLLPGAHSITWSGKNQNNKLSPSGVYICRLEAEGFVHTIKMILIK
ncbi:MAG: T9SS type A sorting domain-containing protein [Bacteroidales bacterium]|nr:T9SS type A sorting domain-containing protein [Bacteroidales bacterium]